MTILTDSAVEHVIQATHPSVLEKAAIGCKTPSPVDASRRNTFTVTYTSGSIFERREPQYSRDDMAAQLQSIHEYRLQRHQEFIRRQEEAASLPEDAKRTGAKILLRTAAVRDILIAEKAHYSPSMMQFVRHAWRIFLEQADAYLSESTPITLPSDGADTVERVERSRIAMENISSLGIWFSGPTISLPLRRYSMQMAGPDGTMQNVVVVGLVSFAYSSYIMRVRAEAQMAVLQELNRLEEQLGMRCLFAPQLVVLPFAGNTI